MTHRSKTLVLCTCDQTMQYDADAFTQFGFDDVVMTNQLCGNDLDVAINTLSDTRDVVFACEQQAQVLSRSSMN